MLKEYKVLNMSSMLLQLHQLNQLEDYKWACLHLLAIRLKIHKLKKLLQKQILKTIKHQRWVLLIILEQIQIPKRQWWILKQKSQHQKWFQKIKRFIVKLVLMQRHFLLIITTRFVQLPLVKLNKKAVRKHTQVKKLNLIRLLHLVLKL